MNLHIVRNPVTNDSRILKETRSLATASIFSRVEICALYEPGHALQEKLGYRIIRHIKLITRNLSNVFVFRLIKYVEWYVRAVYRYRNAPLSIIHCHDLVPLPVAVTLKKLTGASLIYDAHELETERTSTKGISKYIARFVEQMLMKHVDSMITVSPSIQQWYRERFPNTTISLVRNIPEVSDDTISAIPLKLQLHIPENSLLFIYLGRLEEGRGITIALEAFTNEQVAHHVLFMGNGSLTSIIKHASQQCNRIHYMPAVRPDEVLMYAAGADVGLCLIEDVSLSYRYCLPNKLFESILAGLPVLASELPDMYNIVSLYKAGWVVKNNVLDLTEFLTDLSANDVTQMSDGLTVRVNGLSWQSEADELINIYNAILSHQASR